MVAREENIGSLGGADYKRAAFWIGYFLEEGKITQARQVRDNFHERYVAALKGEPCIPITYP